ncbi:MAG: LysR family transcriptional regulator [Oscillospiraceae bacterium]|nr:LysR family transcriptional regulator [Oscillospiraceae bacterium]
MIDVRIETFLTLCRLMNYRKTAEELNMTQPAVTQHIHYLENYYGCRLFIYDRKSLKMTDEAELLKKYAENISYQEKKLKTALSEKGCRQLSIGATKTVGEYVIAEHIGSFLKEDNNRICVNIDNTENLLRALSRGTIDFAVIEGFFDRSHFASRLYRREPFVGICGKSHPFSGREITLEEVMKEHIFVREEGSGTREILEQLLAEENRSLSEFKKISVISSFGLTSKLLCENGGIAFAYRAAGENDPKLGSFKLAGRDIVREFNYVYLDTPFSQNDVEYFDSFRPEKSAE